MADSMTHPNGLTALVMDGSDESFNCLSELYVLDEMSGRWAFDTERDVEGQDVRPSELFDIIGGTGIGGLYAVLFAVLDMTVGQAITSHRILQDRLFGSEAWSNKDQRACAKLLCSSLDEVVRTVGITKSLDSTFKTGATKGFVCVINTGRPEGSRLLRNYKARALRTPQCTIRQALEASLADGVCLPAIRIEDESFSNSMDMFPNATKVLMSELLNVFPKGSKVACIVNLGSRILVPSQSLGNERNNHASDGSCSDLIAQEVTAQCNDLGPFFFRLFVSSKLDVCPLSPDVVPRIKAAVNVCIGTSEMSGQIDNAVRAVHERVGVVTLERLVSLAGEDGQSQMSAKISSIHRHVDDSIFRDVNGWLKPVQQMSKLDANLSARRDYTCEWILKDSTFLKWMRAKRGILWLRGAMGTGKTMMGSFVIDRLLAKPESCLTAYYYFEFSNPSTLSEEALLCSLISQLSHAAPPQLRAVYERHNHGALQPQLGTLRTLLLDIAFASQKQIYLIIDALDEVPELQRKYLLQSLRTFATSVNGGSVHMMVTSRDELDILRALCDTDEELKLEGALVRRDIASFIDQELSSKKWNCWPLEDLQLTRRKLMSGAGDQFRMVACQFDILASIKSSAQLYTALETLPKTLGDTYEHILMAIPKDLRRQVVTLLSFLCFARRNITLQELTALVAVDLGDSDDPESLPQYSPKDHYHDPLDIYGIGGSLIARKTPWNMPGEPFVLQIAHASVKEYLLGQSGHWFSLNAALGHDIIAQACLALLLHFGWKEAHPYSRNNWRWHVNPSGSIQMVHQQQLLFTSFPRRFTRDGSRSTLAAAAYIGLVDLLHALLDDENRDAHSLSEALEASIFQRKSAFRFERHRYALRCCQILVAYEAQFSGSSSGKSVIKWLTWSSDSEDREILKLLVENWSIVVGGEPWAVLPTAVTSGHKDVVLLLLGHKADVNGVDPQLGTALQVAASRGYKEIVQCLIDHGADVNLVAGRDGTALQAASAYGRVDTVVLLLRCGADVNAIGGFHATALQAAAALGHATFALTLLLSGANVHANGGYYGTALQAALVRGHLNTASLLMEMGADMRFLDESNQRTLRKLKSRYWIDLASRTDDLKRLALVPSEVYEDGVNVIHGRPSLTNMGDYFTTRLYNNSVREFICRMFIPYESGELSLIIWSYWRLIFLSSKIGPSTFIYALRFRSLADFRSIVRHTIFHRKSFSVNNIWGYPGTVLLTIKDTRDHHSNLRIRM
ncbi:hypothetical protein DL96DRAFT_1536582 [Flagelloscypha sp. PMI_526]|nr:hypothetical protein DL96DRAFT_1536582 [Flagelloscypha sp. PMI_526]